MPFSARGGAVEKIGQIPLSDIILTTTAPLPPQSLPIFHYKSTEGLPPPFRRPTPPIQKEKRKNLSRCVAVIDSKDCPQFLTHFCYPWPLSYNFLLVSSHSKAGIGHVTCFGQWGICKCDTNRYWKEICMTELVCSLLLPLLWEHAWPSLEWDTQRWVAQSSSLKAILY